MSKFSRREFGKMAATVAGATAASPLLTLTPQTAEAYQTGFIDRWRGPVLTHASLAQLRDCMARGGYNMKKVVTAWGLGTAWNWTSMADVCHHTAGATVVRTHRGDGCRTDLNYDWAYPIPDVIQNEISPWYSTHNGIWIELGNEPNNQCWTKYGRSSNTYIYEWRYWLNLAIDRCRAVFPNAKIISPGLASDTNDDKNLVASELDRWCNIAGDVMRKCDYIGYHAYGHHSFTGGDGTLSTIQPVMARYFPNHPWLMTEYGINDNQILDPAKGKMYAELTHFNAGQPTLHGNCKGALYYHLSVAGGDSQYHIYDGNGDGAYKTRTG